MGFLQQPLPEARIVEIGRGWSLVKVVKTLKQKGVISAEHWFMLLARVEQARYKRHIQAGEYHFPQGETAEQILQRLTSGKVVTHRMVIPEGLTVVEIGKRMQAQGWSQVDTLLADADLARKLSLPVSSLEGWLFPSTYHYQSGDSALDMLSRMAAHSVRILDRQWKVYKKQQKNGQEKSVASKGDAAASNGRTFPLSRYQFLILASIIEKETGQPQERRHISSVFHNRLHKKMRLQTDPTVIYGVMYATKNSNYRGNLTRKHLRTPNPYNTYTRAGLPPTPICNPGEAAIVAAMNPDNSKDLFFVSRGDGFHVFSKTLRQHEAYVDRYQRRRSKQKPTKIP